MPEKDFAWVTEIYPTLQFEGRAFVNGEYRETLSGDRLTTENPATGDEIAQIQNCDEADLDVAVSAARAAFEGGHWSALAPTQRKAVLLRLVELVRLHREELALLDCLEGGKPIRECVETDLQETIECFQWYAELADKCYGETAPAGVNELGLIEREPIGVVAAVTPWNFPLLMAAWKVAPALAAGNSVILKPSELTSLSAIRLAALAHEGGIPPGVFNVLPGSGEGIGAAIGRHPDIDMVAFTGSTEVGRLFLRYAAGSNLKRITLECGGKSPQLVFDDADNLTEIAEEVCNAAFWNMGENCSCGSRLIVNETIAEPLLTEVEKRLGAWQPGDPLCPDTNMGALIEREHLNKVIGFVRGALDAGARLRCGASEPAVEPGYFFKPAILEGVTPDMAVAREEVFGPVLSVLRFRTDDEAVQLANATDYGLAASLYTTDFARAHNVARRLRAGTVSINCFSEGSIATPFGGYKISGFGGRDKGRYALDQYCELKTIWAKIDH